MADPCSGYPVACKQIGSNDVAICQMGIHGALRETEIDIETVNVRARGWNTGEVSDARASTYRFAYVLCMHQVLLPFFSFRVNIVKQIY